jgi:hypothetical protein
VTCLADVGARLVRAGELSVFAVDEASWGRLAALARFFVRLEVAA